MFMQRESNGFDQDSEMLEMNMANITNELSELIVGINPSASDWKLPTEVSRSNATAVGGNTERGGNRLMMPIQENTYISNVENLHFSFQSFRHGHQGNNACIQSQSFGGYVKPRAHSIDVSTFEYTMPRKFTHETRFKRRGSEADAEQHEALLCATIDGRASDPLYAYAQTKRGGGGGTRRKFPRVSFETNEPIDYDSVVIDLKAIGLSTENKETNDVLRLFGAFRKFHYYLNDVVPFAAEPDLTDYPSTFVKPKSPMICTMNVQSQIKHAIHRSNAFCTRLFEKLDENKLADRDKYVECSRSLFILRKMLKQLEPFKTAEFEHKHGVFVNSFGAAQAKNLEILLSQLMGKIRECNIYIEVYTWSITHNVQTTFTPSMETLKKAVAIAGAIIRNSPTMELENEKENQMEISDVSKNEESHKIDANNRRRHNNDDDNDNGGGVAGAAYVPAPNFCARAMLYIGV